FDVGFHGCLLGRLGGRLRGFRVGGGLLVGGGFVGLGLLVGGFLVGGGFLVRGFLVGCGFLGVSLGFRLDFDLCGLGFRGRGLRERGAGEGEGDRKGKDVFHLVFSSWLSGIAAAQVTRYRGNG